MKKQILFFIFLFALQAPTNGMELEKLTLGAIVAIEEIKQLLDFKSKVRLGKVSQSLHHVIQPARLELSVTDCEKMDIAFYNKAMIYYARENNSDMVNFINNNTNGANKNISEAICKKLKKSLLEAYSNISDFNYLKNRNKFAAGGWSWDFKITEITKNITSLFLLQGMDVNTPLDKGNTLLYFIAEGKGEYFPIEQVFAHPNINVNIKNAHGETPLHCTIFEIDKSRLIRESMEKYHPYQDTINQRRDTADKLLKHETINPNLEDNDGKTPLLYALECNRKDLIEFFLKNSGTNINSAGKAKKTPSHYTMIYEYIDLLCNRIIPLDPNIKDGEGNSPLHYGRTNAILDFLFSIPGIDVTIQNQLGETPLHYAIKKPTYSIGGMGCLEVAIYHYDTTQIKRLTEHPQTNINAQNAAGETPLHYAVNCANHKTMVPKEVNIKILMLLLNHADIKLEITNKNGETALDYAMKTKNQDVIELLRKHGAIQGSFLLIHKKLIQACSFIGILSIISATVYAYFHYGTTSK